MKEMDQNARPFDIAKTISDDPNIKVVLIAGPSSSERPLLLESLVCILEARIKSFVISIDDYFLDRDKTPLKRMVIQILKLYQQSMLIYSMNI